MKVNYVKTIGFRKFEKEFETELYNVTNITGMNTAGKSNILYSIINIMLGTNLSGDEKTCLINKKCDYSYGELHFTDNNGVKHILIRGKHRVNTQKNILTLDGKVITQNELVSFYKDKKLFLSVVNPLYFLSKRPSEQKEMVDKYLSDIKPKEIFDTLSEEEKNILLDRHFRVALKDIYDRLKKEDLEEINGQDDDGNISLEDIVYYYADKDSNDIIIDASNFNNKKGDSEVFGISLNELGLYNIEITMKSEQGSLSQLPLSIYYDNVLKSTITIRGTEGECRELGFIFGVNHYIKLYFGASGLDIDKVVIKFMGKGKLPF